MDSRIVFAEEAFGVSSRAGSLTLPGLEVVSRKDPAP
jgi:hypothetical protein